MPSQLKAVTFDAHDPSAVAAFWAGLLGREAVEEADGVFLPGSDTQVGLRFVAAPGEELGAHELHLHLTSTSLEDQQGSVDKALGLGGRHVDVGQLPEEGHIVLADPEDNLLCVIEPGNSFLAGCGYLAEVACDGRREVGVFWADVLGWPLVWDQDDETAIQSPAGGTKVAWGGARDAPKSGRSRQRFDLTTADVPGEVERLVGLGATHLGDLGDGGAVELADPDGIEFSLRAG
jgi:catechol 2,3-dioxygenase-like lactoylglutathione lyase family enzyme